jgi:hypothetical protein
MADAEEADPARGSEPEEFGARLSAVEAAVRHLEAALEGLQDAVHRRSRLDDQRNEELMRRTASASGEENDPDDADGPGPDRVP